MKKFVVFLLVIGLAAGGYLFYKQKFAGSASVTDTPATARKLTVERGDIDLRVSTTGKVISNLDVDIKSKASGQIISMPFDVSDKVTSGDLLVELDPVDENRNVALQQAALVAAQARLAQAMEQVKIAENDVDTQTSAALAELEAAQIKFRESQSRLERQEDLFRKRLISSEDLDIARSEASASQRAVTQSQVRLTELRNLPRTVELRRQDVNLNLSELKRAEINMENAMQRLIETKIYAPMDGVVTSRPVQTGQIIASGISNVGGGTSLLTISDLSHIFINASVDESDIGKIRKDQAATITADAFPGKRFRGKVVRVATKGVTNSNVVTFEVKIEVEGEGKALLRPEMSGNVEVQADRREDVLILPNEAIQFGRDGYFVEVPSKDPNTSNTRVQVKTGLTDGLNTEILEGLEEGKEVAAPSGMVSRFARGPGGEPGAGGSNSGQNFNRGLQRAARTMGRGR